VNQLFNLIDLERSGPGPLKTINRLHQPELLSQNSQRLVLRIGQELCNQAPTNAAHAIEIDLGFSDPSRVLQRLGVHVRTCNRARNCLRHRSSGEWLSSEWPVCAISETGAPRRMGAALTYARRYALFTLVGIAGEYDLDAPDLAEGGKADAANKTGVADVQDVVVSSQLGEAVGEGQPATAPRRTEKVLRPAPTVLGQEQSAALREKPLADLSQLQSDDEAADWVHKNLAAKNTLITADADAVEAGFCEKLATIEVASAARQERLDSAPAENPEPPVGKPFLTTIEGAVAVAAPVTSDNASARRRRIAAKPFACATRSTASSSGLSRALCAAARQPRPITFGLLSPVLSAER
jgi:hypothetical protein